MLSLSERIKIKYLLSYKKLAWVSCLSLVVLFSVSADAKKNKIPEWAETPKLDTKYFMFGIGSADTRGEAKKAALDEIAGKIITKIETSTLYTKAITNGHVSETYQKKIRTKTDELALTGYEVVQEKKIKKRYWLQIRMNIPEFVSVSKQQFSELNHEVSEGYKNISNETILNMLTLDKKIPKKIDTSIHRATVLGAVDKTFDAIKAVENLKKMSLGLKSRRASLQVYIKTEDQDMDYLVQSLATHLSKYGVSTTREGINGIPRLKISGEFKETTSSVRPSVNASVVIAVIDEFGRELATRNVKLVGSSMLDFDAAKRAAVNRFLKTLNKSNITKKLGLTTKRR